MKTIASIHAHAIAQVFDGNSPLAAVSGGVWALAVLAFAVGLFLATPKDGHNNHNRAPKRKWLYGAFVGLLGSLTVIIGSIVFFPPE